MQTELSNENDAATAKLLTIAIPTFNRDKFLSRLLRSIQPQLSDYSAVIDVLICDNFSRDATEEVVREFVANGFPLTYVRHSQNLGLDRNILECFRRAKTEYVWIFGDDDVLLEGALAVFIPLIQGRHFSHIYVGGYSFFGEFVKKRKFFLNIGPTRITSSTDMIQTANVYLTFITGNIVSKSAAYAADPNATFEEHLGSVINHLTFFFAALKTNRPCLVIENQLIASQGANSGGYGSCQVFGINMMKIVTSEFPSQPKIHALFANSILEKHFPYQLNFIKKTDAFFKEDQFEILKSVYRKNYRFWIYCYPIIVLPLPFANWYSFAVRAALKSKRVVQGSFRYWKLAWFHRFANDE
jgi:abequosyltransferase